MIRILVTLLLTGAGTPLQTTCQRDTLAAVVNDHDAANPYVLVTTTGRRLRTYGQDFVNPNQWKPRDLLDICPDSDSTSLHVHDLRRREELLTANDAFARPEPPLQIMNGPGFQALLARVATQCPSSRVRYATPATLLDVDEQFEAGLDSAAARRLRAHKRLTPSGDYRGCAGRNGTSCPANEAMDALERSGLLQRFTHAVCAHGGGPWR